MKITFTDPGLEPLTVNGNWNNLFALLKEHNCRYTVAMVYLDNGLCIFCGTREIGESNWECVFISDKYPA